MSQEKAERSPNTSNETSLEAAEKAKAFPIFKHQVAGHFPLLWNSGTVCKPLNPLEFDFYVHLKKNVPTLSAYAPKFYGVIDLSNSSFTIGSQLQNCKSNEAFWARSQSDGQKKSLSSQYIVLEDLTYAYFKPSILDLKIGTRQHGDDDSQEKIARKIARCEETTSSTLGLRLCGMQVYKPSEKRYQFRDKYYGRSLDSSGFGSSLYEFFHDDDKLRVDTIKLFLERVLAFRTVIATETRHRFYSSSLLLIYESLPDEQEKQMLLESAKEAKEASRWAKELETLEKERESKKHIESDCNSNSSPNIQDYLLDPFSRKRKTTHAQAILQARSKGNVDLRIIDFAHTIKLSENDTEAVDAGFVLGLNTLIGYIVKFLTQHSSEEGKLALDRVSKFDQDIPKCCRSS